MNRIGAAVLALLVLVLAGCAAGQTGAPDPFFSRTRIGLDSVDGAVRSVRLLGVAVVSPGAPGSKHLAGSSAGLLLTVANDGRTGDVLTGASADVADRVVLRDGNAPARQVRVAVPPGGVAVIRDVTGRHLELVGLREPLRSGFSVPVTFRFRDAGAVTLSVPIRTYTDVPVDRVHEPSL